MRFSYVISLRVSILINGRSQKPAFSMRRSKPLLSVSM